jgi:lactoylglutathione lyase/methylmalonyl-CoA/ethylmalonyl-CoA epimerase
VRSSLKAGAASHFPRADFKSINGIWLNICSFSGGYGYRSEQRWDTTVEKYNVTNIFLKCSGETKLHFMIPQKGILRNFNNGNGGLHHIAFCTPNISAYQKRIESHGLRFISEFKQKGIGQFHFNFVYPNVAGLNVEIIEDPEIEWPKDLD